MLKIESERMILIAANLEMAEAELLNRDKLESLVGAKFPVNWPPPLNDENSMKWFGEYLKSNPDAAGWVMWYFCLKISGNDLPVIGSGGFKGKPDDSGIVEIGYSIMEDHQRNGYAPEAVRVLTGWAFRNPKVKKVVAQTFPKLLPSIKVLEKCGFKFVGKGYEDGTILYEIIKTEN